MTIVVTLTINGREFGRFDPPRKRSNEMPPITAARADQEKLAGLNEAGLFEVLRDREEQRRQAAMAEEEAARLRNAAILELVGRNVPQARIAESIGVSRGRVGQIIARAEGAR